MFSQVSIPGVTVTSKLDSDLGPDTYLGTLNGQPVRVLAGRPTAPNCAAPFHAWLTANQLRHPGIVPIKSSGRTDAGLPFVVVPQYPNGSWAQRSQSAPQPVADTVRIGMLAAQTLAVAHSQGLVHGALQPSIVFFDEQERPVISDFGQSIGDWPSDITWSAPEVLRGDEPTPATDVYGLVLSMWTALAGQNPFAQHPGEALDSATLRHRIETSQVTPLPQAGPLVGVLWPYLAPDPKLRPTAAELASRLAEYRPNSDSVPTVPPVKATPTFGTPKQIDSAPTSQIPPPAGYPYPTVQHSIASGVGRPSKLGIFAFMAFLILVSMVVVRLLIPAPSDPTRLPNQPKESEISVGSCFSLYSGHLKDHGLRDDWKDSVVSCTSESARVKLVSECGDSDGCFSDSPLGNHFRPMAVAGNCFYGVTSTANHRSQAYTYRHYPCGSNPLKKRTFDEIKKKMDGPLASLKATEFQITDVVYDKSHCSGNSWTFKNPDDSTVHLCTVKTILE